MEHEIGDFESGRIKVIDSPGELVVSLHWPFDRETDEWIDVSASFSLSVPATEPGGQESAVFKREDSGSVLDLKRISDGRFRLFLRGQGAGRPVEADLILPAKIGDELLRLVR